MQEVIESLIQIAKLPLLPYVAISVSTAYFGIASLLARRERKEEEAFFVPPPDLH